MKKYCFLFIGLLLAFCSTAQNNSVSPEVHVIRPAHFGISRPLRELFTNEKPGQELYDPVEHESSDREHRRPQVFKYSAEDGPQYGDDKSVRQTEMGTRPGKSPVANWQGQSGSGTPPDPTGAAGLTEYVQCVNVTTFKIWDKATGAVIGTVHNLGALWSPSVSNGGDPVVLYDKYADRWILTQLSGSSYALYIAISTTGDPTGTYYTYTYMSTDFPDYPKYSIWADGYYMTTNYLSSDTLLPRAVFCFERDSMLAGNPAARAVFTPYNPGAMSTTNWYTAMPADADGQLPPFGTPLPLVAFYENAWNGGSDSLLIWNMSVDWSPAVPTATITGPVALLPAPFDASYDSLWNDIPQPNSSVMLDGMGGIIQFRAQWRKWAGYNTLVINLPVKLGTNPVQRSIRWAELRQDQGTGAWSIYQESTYAPDSYSRWMASIAMDDEGNISLCYSLSGPTSLLPNISPSLAYTGRLASDPLNTMTFAETIAVSGAGALSFNRYGDYSHTTLDPADGITFWHTGEYVQGNGKRTRIYSFALSSTLGIHNPETIKPVLAAYQSENMLQVIAGNLPYNDLMTLDVFDLSGKPVKSKMVLPVANSVSTNFPIGDLAKGSYFVRIGKANSSFQKVIKILIL